MTTVATSATAVAVTIAELRLEAALPAALPAGERTGAALLAEAQVVRRAPPDCQVDQERFQSP
jgi:hypothetical protein